MEKIISVSKAINNHNVYTAHDSYCLIKVNYENGNTEIHKHHNHEWINIKFKQHADNKVRISNVRGVSNE